MQKVGVSTREVTEQVTVGNNKWDICSVTNVVVLMYTENHVHSAYMITV
jgi:hypothetical protein